MVAENYKYRLTRAKGKNIKHVQNELALCGVFCDARPSCHGNSTLLSCNKIRTANFIIMLFTNN